MKSIMLGAGVLTLFVFLAGMVQAAPKIKGEAVEYKSGAVTLKGYLAYDENQKGKRPGVLVVHEWWGHNEYARMRARMLAELGYAALAVDMYGDGKQAMHPSEAGKFSSEVMQHFDTEGKPRFLAAEEFLKKQPVVDPTRIAAIGYCFGGGVVLNMARQGADLKAVASFHGSLAAVKPAERGTVKAKIRVYNGADDKFTQPEMIAAFKKEMTDAGADFKFINYPGAIHAFTNPEATELGKKFNLPLAYNEKGDKESWADMTKFFAEALKK
ncbi:MAG TPA: dienelactone hydrolase family protein [Nitrospirota bacterium]|nr:dienelactone hydrolase family protein [Nitrospirota bacterium]